MNAKTITIKVNDEIIAEFKVYEATFEKYMGRKPNNEAELDKLIGAAKQNIGKSKESDLFNGIKELFTPIDELSIGRYLLKNVQVTSTFCGGWLQLNGKDYPVGQELKTSLLGFRREFEKDSDAKGYICYGDRVDVDLIIHEKFPGVNPIAVYPAGKAPDNFELPVELGIFGEYRVKNGYLPENILEDLANLPVYPEPIDFAYVGEMFSCERISGVLDLEDFDDNKIRIDGTTYVLSSNLNIKGELRTGEVFLVYYIIGDGIWTNNSESVRVCKGLYPASICAFAR